MGIPAFFRQIVEKYPKTHSPKLEQSVDYFFIDFNSIIYDVYNAIDKSKIYSTNARFEAFLISEVTKRLGKIINDIVNPKKLLYIAMDGPAPRAKMVQQRWRRYKGAKDAEYFRELKEKYDVGKDNITWQASANISPGTKFLHKLGVAIQKKINAGFFNKGNSKLKIIFSDGNVPGEGEHKFLPLLRELTLDKKDTVLIYSPDADMIVLAMATHKNNIWILRKVKGTDDATDVEKIYKKNGHEFLYLSIDEYRKAFVETLDIASDKDDNKKNDNIRIITDYVFLTFFGGNDFVMPIPYLKIKEEKRGKDAGNKTGLGILLNIYVKLLPEFREYLVIVIKRNGQTRYQINMPFFKKIFESLSESEDFYMRGIQFKINKVMQGLGDEAKLEKEEGKPLFEREKIRYEHYEYYSQLHPEFDKYKDLFKKFDFTRPKHEWRPKYYEHFFNLDPKNVPEYNEFRTKICINYLESFIFTLRYYFEGIPSWSWYYHFRAPPLASDILTNLNRFIPDINKITFILDEPYKPFDQLMMILPEKMGNLLPKGYHTLMKKELLDYYPIDFELDVFLGGKHIYAEPILPPIDDKRLLTETKGIKLTKDEKERNELKAQPMIRNV